MGADDASSVSAGCKVPAGAELVGAIAAGAVPVGPALAGAAPASGVLELAGAGVMVWSRGAKGSRRAACGALSFGLVRCL